MVTNAILYSVTGGMIGSGNEKRDESLMAPLCVQAQQISRPEWTLQNYLLGMRLMSRIHISTLVSCATFWAKTATHSV